MRVVWQHWIIHASLIAAYEGFIGRWCIKGWDACLGCWSSDSKKVGYCLREAQRDIKQPLRCLNLLNLLIIFYYHADSPQDCFTYILSINQISLLLLHTGLKSVLAHITYFFLLFAQSVDHNRCLLATAFDTVSIASLLENKRRISFETLK